MGEPIQTLPGSSKLLCVHRTLHTFLIRQFLLNDRMLNVVVEMSNLSLPLGNERLEDKDHVVFSLDCQHSESAWHKVRTQ